MTGDVFVFFSRNRQSVKLLRWDTDGFLLYQKRLEKGSFEQPRQSQNSTESAGMSNCFKWIKQHLHV